MAAGLVGLLDDVAALARLAAASVDDVAVAAGKATTKAAGVLIDDAAVTPQYVHGLAAQRELPIIRRIATGSLRNKFLFVLPALLVLIEFAPWALAPLLMLGGAYLCYEGVHKVHAVLTGHDDHAKDDGQPIPEDQIVKGAIRTDLILSGEIMVIAVNEVVETNDSLFELAAILAVVAVIITVLVYGAVALIVKADDLGLLMVAEGGARAQLGRRIVAGMPKVLTFLSVLGTAAMLWVGGHIWVEQLHELGVDVLYDPIHGMEEAVRDAAGGLLAWLAATIASSVVGLAIGAIVLPIVQQVTKLRSTDPEPSAH